MPNDFPMNDPRSIWKNQTTEAFKMSANDLRRKAQQREKKSRFEAIYSIIIGIILFVFFAWTLVRTHEVVPRIGFGLMSLWSINLAYQRSKRLWRTRPAPDETLNATLQSYRRDLEKGRDYAQHVWRKAGLSLLFLGLAMALLPPLIESLGTPRLLLDFVPLFGLLALWCAIFFPLMKRNRRKLQQEIEALGVFESESRS